MAPSPRKATRGMAKGVSEGPAAPVEREGGAVQIGKMPRLRIHVQIDGLLSIYAVRAVRTALAAVPGVMGAEVSMKGAVLDADAPLDRAALDDALALAGVRAVQVREEKGMLPLL